MQNDRAGDVRKILVNDREMAAALGVSPRTLWSLTDAGVIPAVYLGQGSQRKTVKRYHVRDVERAIENITQGGQIPADRLAVELGVAIEALFEQVLNGEIAMPLFPRQAVVDRIASGRPVPRSLDDE